MSYSLKRIGRQVRKLKIFDEIILYTEKDLPDYIHHSPLMTFDKGGGMYLWKPVIIWETLQNHAEGDIVVYIDAGCSVKKSRDWNILFRLMDSFDSICFQYGTDYPEWEKFGTTSSEMRVWTKISTLELLEEITGNDKLATIRQVLGGLVFVKGKNNTLIRKWKEFMFTYPQYVLDPLPGEIQPPEFCSHRHDQSILSALAYADPYTILLPETVEHYDKYAFAWASRFRAGTLKEAIIAEIKTIFFRRLGWKRYARIVSLVK